MSGDVASSEQFIERHGYLTWLGVRIEAVGEGRAVIRLPDEERFANPGRTGSAHGGIVATLVDLASAVALRSTFEDPEGGSLTTIDLNVSYLRPATGALLATADVVRAGGSTGVAEVTVERAAAGADDAVAAVGRTTFRLFR